MAEVVGLIPARAGSKGLAGKNLRLLNGRPLLSYSIDAARQSDIFDRIVVSSDGDDILEFARQHSVGAERRDPSLADDNTPMDPVIADVIRKRQLAGDDIVILLQPTSPLRTGKHIRDAYHWFLENDCDGLISVVQLDSKVLKAYLQTGKYLAPVHHENTAYTRRQDLPAVYLPNGAIYIFRVAAFMEQQQIPRERIVPFVMTADESLDIDNEEDLMQCSRVLMGIGGKNG